jgi:O-antigen ligase
MSRNKKNQHTFDSKKDLPWLAKAIFFLCALSLVVPILSSPHVYLGSFYFKGTVFQLLTELMFACWVMLLVTRLEYRPKWRNPVVLGLLVATLTMLAVLPLAIDPAYSFWSYPSRMAGVLNYLHYFVWLLIVISTSRSVSNYRVLVGISCLTAVAVGFYGFIQWVFGPAGEILSTLNNQSFFGAYMMTHVFLAVWLWSSSRFNWLRCLSILTIVVGTTSVFLSGSRGAALILFVGIIFIATMLFLTSSSSRNYKIFLPIFLLVFTSMVIGAVFVLRLPAVRKEAQIYLPIAIQRIIYRDFGHDRLVLWGMALQGIAERPVFGWGMEQYELIFYKYFDPTDIDKVVLSERYADLVHNQYLDTLVASGVIGLSGWLFFLGTVAWAAIAATRKMNSAEERRRLILIGSVLFVYITYSFFMFDTPATLIATFLGFALISTYYAEIAGLNISSTGGRSSVQLNQIVIPIILLLLLVMWLVNIEPAYKVIQLKSAQREVYINRTQALEKFKRVFSGYNPYLHDLRLSGLNSLKVWAENVSLHSSPMEALLRLISTQLAMSAEAKFYNARFQLAAASAHRLLGAYDPEALSVAEIYVRRALEMSFNRFDPYYELGEIAMMRYQVDEALKNFRLAKERMPILNNGQHAFIHFRLACAYALKCDIDAVRREFSAAENFKYETYKDNRLAIILGSCAADHDVGWFTNDLNKLLEVYPDHPTLLVAAAKIFKASGLDDRATEMLSRLQQRHPEKAEQLAKELDL